MQPIHIIVLGASEQLWRRAELTEDIFDGTSGLACLLRLHLVATTKYSSPRSGLNNQGIIFHTKQHFQKQKKKRDLVLLIWWHRSPAPFPFLLVFCMLAGYLSLLNWWLQGVHQWDCCASVPSKRSIRAALIHVLSQLQFRILEPKQSHLLQLPTRESTKEGLAGPRTK